VVEDGTSRPHSRRGNPYTEIGAVCWILQGGLTSRDEVSIFIGGFSGALATNRNGNFPFGAMNVDLDH
jgi:hypothetical protein